MLIAVIILSVSLITIIITSFIITEYSVELEERLEKEIKQNERLLSRVNQLNQENELLKTIIGER